MIALRSIGEVTERVVSWDPRKSSESEFDYIDLSSVDRSTKMITAERVPCSDAPSRARQLVRSGDVLVSTVRPNLNGVARVPRHMDGATASTGFAVLRPKNELLDGQFLFHWVRHPRFVADMARRATGASYPAVSDRIVRNSTMPWVPVPEQRRIAAVLDKADTLRSCNTHAVDLTSSFSAALFHEMFGDPASNPLGWEVVPFGDALVSPLRNGLSPATNGAHMGTVLTLSAITGAQFDESACKPAAFSVEPPISKRVAATDFLICRGNGNRSLVGSAKYPARDLPEMVFPDTMIAARVAELAFSRAFLEYVWSSSATRRQIERMARTTNGTQKVNQQMIESVALIRPPIDRQRAFAVVAGAVNQRRQATAQQESRLDELFASLQQQAFRGEL